MLPFTFYRTIHLDCPVFIWRHTMKEEKIKVLALLPMELPKEIDLDNTLEAMQKFVGGLIECITSRWSRTPGRTQAKFVCCCHIL